MNTAAPLTWTTAAVSETSKISRLGDVQKRSGLDHVALAIAHCGEATQAKAAVAAAAASTAAKPLGRLSTGHTTLRG
jgi:hypothetical protein